MRKGVSLSFFIALRNKSGKRGEKFFRGKVCVSKERFVKKAKGKGGEKDRLPAKGDPRITRRV